MLIGRVTLAPRLIFSRTHIRQLAYTASTIHNGAMTIGPNQGFARPFWGIPWAAAYCISVAFSILLSHANDSVTIEVTGEIDPKCRLSNFPAGFELGQISSPGMQTLPFQVDCNTPFEYSVRSHNGALKHFDSLEQNAAFSSTLPYKVEFRLQTDAGLILALCESAILATTAPSCGHGTSNGGIAISQTASMKITWLPDNHLIAGTYSDVITLTIRPSV